LEEELELLRLFLESADFGQLRSLSEEILLSGKRVEFRLRSTGGVPEYEVEINRVSGIEQEDDSGEFGSHLPYSPSDFIATAHN
jgi:hypothetical protein